MHVPVLRQTAACCHGARLGKQVAVMTAAATHAATGVRNVLTRLCEDLRLRMKPTMSFTAFMVSEAMARARSAPSIKT